MQKVQIRLTCIAQKRRCLSSLIIHDNFVDQVLTSREGRETFRLKETQYKETVSKRNGNVRTVENDSKAMPVNTNLSLAVWHFASRPILLVKDNRKVQAEEINPSSPKSDQHQFSPNNVNTLSKETVMRFDKMITSGKCIDLLIHSLN